MTSEDIALFVVKCGDAAMRWAEAAEDPDDTSAAAWLQVKMLAEIAYQLAVANERAAPPGDPGPAYVEYSPSGIPVRKPL